MERVFRKGFWLYEEHIKNIKAEAKKDWGNNESALMRHIISEWFKK